MRFFEDDDGERNERDEYKRMQFVSRACTTSHEAVGKYALAGRWCRARLVLLQHLVSIQCCNANLPDSIAQLLCVHAFSFSEPRFLIKCGRLSRNITVRGVTHAVTTGRQAVHSQSIHCAGHAIGLHSG